MKNKSQKFSQLQKDSQDLQSYIFSKIGKQKDSIYVLLTYLLAECGEVADRARALEGNRVKSSHIQKDDLAKEIVDCVYNLMLIANHYDIDLDEYWKDRLEKIKKKFE